MHKVIFLCFLPVVFAGVASTNTTKDCKCVPGNACWPSSEDFAILNETLSGHLIQGVPPASVCYPSEPHYNATACETVTAGWFSSSFHANDPISVGWPWWANNSCPPIFPNGTSVTGDPEAGRKGCSLGGYPVYSVNATEEEHVVTAVKFAKEKNIRLNVKSTGHSFQGRSTAFGSLSVWTHHLRGIQYHKNFLPKTCRTNETGMAFTIAAGERVRDIYEAADERNAVVVAGSAQYVGVVGWFSSGGHGPLSSTYGLGVDNILEVRIVTPDGVLRTATRCINSDLFWALRGGGGGTFGVITSVTMKAYPSPHTTRHQFSMSLIQPANETGFWDLVASVMAEFPRLKEGGMQGYGVFLPPGAIPGLETEVLWTWTWSYNVYDKPNGTIESLFAPIAQKLDPRNGTTIIYTSEVQTYPSFFALWNSTVGNEGVASGGAALGSRLLPAEALINDTPHLARILQNVSAKAENSMAPPVLQAYMIANNHTGANDEVSVTPAWKDAVLHFIVADGFNDSDTFAEAQPTINRVTYQRVAALKSLAPESGAYQNEGDPFDPNWSYDFFGKNYPRLRNIKETYDPDNMLWCISCVGSEYWAEEESGRLCRVPSITSPLNFP